MKVEMIINHCIDGLEFKQFHNVLPVTTLRVIGIRFIAHQDAKVISISCTIQTKKHLRTTF